MFIIASALFEDHCSFDEICQDYFQHNRLHFLQMFQGSRIVGSNLLLRVSPKRRSPVVLISINIAVLYYKRNVFKCSLKKPPLTHHSRNIFLKPFKYI